MNASRSRSDVLRTPIRNSTEDIGQYLWLVIGCSLGGALLFTIAIAAFLYACRRSRKKHVHHPGSEFCPQDLISSLSSSASDDKSEFQGTRNYRRPLGPSASLDPPALLHLTAQKCVQPRPSLPRWHSFDCAQTTPIVLDSTDRDSDSELPPCLHGRLWFSLNYSQGEGRLDVTLHRAKYLPGRGFMNSPRDPFVKMYILPDEEKFHQTKIRKRTLAPKFNETFTFNVNPDDLRKRTLKFSVYDVDKQKIRHCLGHALQPLDLLKSMGSGQFYRDLEIAPQPIAPPGDVQLSLSCNPFSNRIKVTVCRIRLPEHHSAVFVRVELYHGRRMVKCKRTRALECMGCEEQGVDESFGFAISGRFFDSCSLAFVVVLEGGAPLGQVVVGPYMYARGEPLQHWQEMISNSRKTITRWHPLTNCGETKKLTADKRHHED